MKTSKHARILQDEKAQSIAKIKNPVTPNIEHYLDGFFSELQHTPGPWYWGNTPHYLRMQQPGIPITIRSKAHTEEIATVWTYHLPTERNSKLIARAPDMLRSICRTYLYLLMKFPFNDEQNSFVRGVRISLNDTLASLRNEISNATGLECQHIQETFEDYAISINEGIDVKQHSAWVKQGRPGE